MLKVCHILLSGSAALALLAGCDRRTAASPTPAPRYFDARGTLVSVSPDRRSLVIHHDAISNYMAAMTMPFDVRDSNQPPDLHPGDAISFRLVVMPTEGWIDHVAKIAAPSAANEAAPETVHVSSAVDTLAPGDPLPPCRFTNELGAAVDLSQFKGRVIAFTFFFIACPFPNFCPRMTANFSETARKLAAVSNGPPFHLFSLSFDPRDTPAHLLEYAKAHGYDPNQWSFLAGDPHDVSQFADLFDEQFWPDPKGAISHNLRTVVVDPSGRVRKIFEGSAWTSDQLFREILAANSSGGRSSTTP